MHSGAKPDGTLDIAYRIQHVAALLRAARGGGKSKLRLPEKTAQFAA
jgi:hypothetical protein